MDYQKILDDLHRDFTYASDGKLDTWSLHRTNSTFTGDCEDFALALAWRLADYSLSRFILDQLLCRTVIWQTKTPAGVGHAMLWHRGAGWADNTHLLWSDKAQYPRILPWYGPLLLVKLLLAPVFLRANRALG